MTISIRLSDTEADLFKSYAAMHNMSISDLVRQSIQDRIDDEYDLKAFDEAMAEYRKNPVTYSHAEVCKMMEQLDNELYD